jgi:hypothetical protein
MPVGVGFVVLPARRLALKTCREVLTVILAP